MNRMMSIYGLTRLPFSKDIPASEMLDTENLQAARERLEAALEPRLGRGNGRFRLWQNLPVARNGRASSSRTLSHSLRAQCHGKPARFLSATDIRHVIGG